MTTFKIVISEKGKSYQVEKEQKDCPVLEKKIGETVSAILWVWTAMSCR